MGMMFLLIMTGFLLRKLGIITDAGKKCITDILLYAILPCNIIKAFTTDLGTDHCFTGSSDFCSDYGIVSL